MPSVQSLNGLNGILTLTGTQNVSISDDNISAITITGPDLSPFATIAEVNAVSGTLQTQIDGIDNHSRYTDAEAVSATVAERSSLSGTLSAEIDSDVAAHAAIADAHHARYTDSEAVSATDAERTSLSGSLQSQIDDKSDVVHVHDHGISTGLGDDDHTQYALVDGGRAFTSTVGGIDPVASADLATKNYVDGQILTLRNELLSVSGSLQSNIDQLRAELVALSGTCCPGTFPGSEVSIDQEGGVENMAKATGVDIGIGNEWSISMWVKPNSSTPAGSTRLIEIQPASGGANVIRIMTTVSPTTLLVTTVDSGNTNIKVYNYNDVFTANTWSFLVLAWDGTDLKFYHQGSELTPDTMQVDNSGTMSSTDRLLGVGGLRVANPAASFDGRLHSYAVWDVSLGANAISELYNSGEGAAIDYAIDGTNYTSSADLLHWWRLGLDENDIGKDYGNHTTLIDVMDDATGIDSSDVVSDYPGM